MRKLPTLLSLAGLLALGFVLSASQCENEVTFPGAVAEICNDKIDNDSDGVADCLDSECAANCKVSVTISKPGIIDHDTLAVSGTVQNATSVVVTVLPQGRSDSAKISGESWSGVLRDLSNAGTTYTVTVTATGPQGQDTAVTTVSK